MIARPAALLDTNVIVAAVAEAHEHHVPSLAVLANRQAGSLAVAAHSYTEAYAVLTHPATAAPFRWPAEDAWAALESVASVTRLVGLTHGQMFDAVRDYASGGGTGSRLYDKLIGETAVQNGIGSIVTWNVKHMRGLFGQLVVADPAEYVSR